MKKSIILLITLITVLSISINAQITRTTWQIHSGIDKEPIEFTSSKYGDPAAYSKMKIPPKGHNGWKDIQGERISIHEKSILTRPKQQLDFTYFQTFITVPENVNITKFSVSYDQADDGARIYLFNTDYPFPNGHFNPKADLIYEHRNDRSVGAVDLKNLLKKGETNRLVIVQFDNAPTGNNIEGIHLKVDGKEIKKIKTVENCQPKYETVELNGRTWIKTNIKVPQGGFEAMNGCCSGLQHVQAGRGKNSPFWRKNYDYDGKFQDPKDKWFELPFVSAFNDNPNDKHGAIVNYFVVEKCNVCPSGFRLPTEQEFMDMANAVGGRNLMSRTGEDWGAIGRIDGYGSVVRGRFGEYWTSTPSAEGHKAQAFVLNSNGTFHISPDDKRTGCYVRCIKDGEGEGAEGEDAELNKRQFEMLAHSIHGGNEQGLWFLGVDKGEADKAVGRNGQVRVRIVKRASNGSVSTVDGQPAVILNLVPTDERNHELGGHLYIFNAAGIGDGQYYLATGQNSDKNIYIRHKSTGSATTAIEFAFRSHNAFTKDGTSGEFRSFESVVHPGHYLRHSYHKALLATKNENDKVWRGDVSWKLVDPK